MTSTSPLDRISVLIPTLTNLPILAVSLPGHDEGKEEKEAPEDLDERRFAQRLDSLLDGCHRERVRGLHQLREASKRKARLEARIRVRQTEERELRHLLKLRRDENDLRKKELAIKNEQDALKIARDRNVENDHEEKLKGWTLNCHQAFKTLGSKLAEQDNRTNLQIKKCKYLTQQLKLKQTQISSALDRIQEFRNRTMRLSQHLDDLEQSSELTELEQKLKLCQESVNSTDFEYAQIMDLTRAAIDKRKEAADTIMKQNEILNASFSLLHSHHTTAEASSQTEPHTFCSNLCREILLDIFQKLPI